MRKIYFFTFLILLITYCGNPLHAQQTRSDTIWKELILGVPKVSDKNLEQITDTIKALEGLQYIMFCPQDKLFLIKYNPRIYLTKEDIIRAIENKKISIPMFIKEGTFQEVKEMCAQ